MVSQGEDFRRGTISGVIDFGYRINLCLRGLRHDFLSNFFVPQYRKTLQGNPSVLCFRKFLVAKKFMDEKGGVSKNSVEFFCVTVPKFFEEEPFKVSLISGIEKFYAS